MSHTHKSRFSTGQRSSALLCFVALILIYAPIATAAAMAVTGACCNGDECPIHGNHRHSQNSERPPMDCGHGEHNMSTMDNCSMSCCHDTEQPAIHGNLFLLTQLSVSTSFTRLSDISFAPAATNLSPVFAPLAPPPKSFVS